MAHHLSRTWRATLLAALMHSPVLAQSSCSICPFNEIITIPDAIIIAGTAGFIDSDKSCAEVEAMANGGSYSLGQCVLLRSFGVPELWYV